MLFVTPPDSLRHGELILQNYFSNKISTGTYQDLQVGGRLQGPQEGWVPLDIPVQATLQRKRRSFAVHHGRPQEGQEHLYGRSQVLPDHLRNDRVRQGG